MLRVLFLQQWIELKIIPMKMMKMPTTLIWPIRALQNFLKIIKLIEMNRICLQTKIYRSRFRNLILLQGNINTQKFRHISELRMRKKIWFSDIARSSQRVPNFLKFILFVEDSPYFEPIKSNGVNSDFFCARAISKVPS